METMVIPPQLEEYISSLEKESALKDDVILSLQKELDAVEAKYKQAVRVMNMMGEMVKEMHGEGNGETS